MACIVEAVRLFVTCLLHQHNGFFLIAAGYRYVDDVLLEFAPFGYFRVGVDFRVGGVFVVQVGKQVLRFAAAQPFDEFLGLGGFFGVFGYACTGYVDVRAFALLVGEEDADGQVGLFILGGLLVSIVITVCAGWWSLPFWVFTVFAVQFFRDPARPAPQDEDAVLSPVDGRIVVVERATDPYRKTESLKISVFINDASSKHSSLVRKAVSASLMALRP